MLKHFPYDGEESVHKKRYELKMQRITEQKEAMLRKAKDEATKGKEFQGKNAPLENTSIDKIGLTDRDKEKELCKKIAADKDDSAVANAMQVALKRYETELKARKQ